MPPAVGGQEAASAQGLVERSQEYVVGSARPIVCGRARPASSRRPMSLHHANRPKFLSSPLPGKPPVEASSQRSGLSNGRLGRPLMASANFGAGVLARQGQSTCVGPVALARVDVGEHYCRRLGAPRSNRWRRSYTSSVRHSGRIAHRYSHFNIHSIGRVWMFAHLHPPDAPTIVAVPFLKGNAAGRFRVASGSSHAQRAHAQGRFRRHRRRAPQARKVADPFAAVQCTDSRA